VAADGPLVATARVLLVLQYGIMVLEGRKVVREPVDILPVHCADLVKSRFLRLVLVNGEDLLSVFLHEGIEDRLDRDRVLGQPEAIGHAGFGMGFEEISNYSRNKQLFLKREFYFRNFYFFFFGFWNHIWWRRESEKEDHDSTEACEKGSWRGNRAPLLGKGRLAALETAQAQGVQAAAVVAKDGEQREEHLPYSGAQC